MSNSFQPVPIVPSQSVVKDFVYYGTKGTTGTFGATGSVSATIPGANTNDLRLDVVVGSLPACTATWEACKIQLVSTASNVGNYDYSQVLTIKGHGVTGAKTMVIKGQDANSVVSVIVDSSESGLTGANFTDFLQTVITGGSTGPAQITAVLTPVSKGSYNLPQ